MPNHDSDDRSLWQRTYEDLLAKVRDGAYPAGGKMPSEHDLCRTYSVSRITIRRAMRELELAGHIVRRRGSGTEVVKPRVDLSSKLIHVIMSPAGHVLSDIHTALMTKLGDMGFSHRIWTPDKIGEIADWEAISSIPARGTIIIP